MANIGLLHFFLCIQVLQLDDDIFLYQPKYVMDLLQRFKMDESKPCAITFQSRVKLTKEFNYLRVNATLYL